MASNQPLPPGAVRMLTSALMPGAVLHTTCAAGRLGGIPISLLVQGLTAPCPAHGPGCILLTLQPQCSGFDKIEVCWPTGALHLATPRQGATPPVQVGQQWTPSVLLSKPYEAVDQLAYRLLTEE